MNNRAVSCRFHALLLIVSLIWPLAQRVAYISEIIREDSMVIRSIKFRSPGRAMLSSLISYLTFYFARLVCYPVFCVFFFFCHDSLLVLQLTFLVFSFFHCSIIRVHSYRIFVSVCFHEFLILGKFAKFTKTCNWVHTGIFAMNLIKRFSHAFKSLENCKEHRTF